MVFAKDKKAIFKDTVYYTSGNYISQVIGIITAIVVRRCLGPALMGMWELLKVVLRYSAYSELGASTIAARDIPFHMGRNDEKEAEEIKNICFSYVIGVYFLMAFLIMLWSFFKSASYQRELILGFRSISLILILTGIYGFFVNMMRAYKNFKVLSQMVVLNAVLILILSLALLPSFKIYGMYMAASLTLITCCVYAFVRTGYKLRPGFDRVRFFYVVKTGTPILLSGVGVLLLFSIDKIMIAKFMDFEQLGFYSIAGLVIMTIYNLPRSFGIVVFPRMQEHYGKAAGDVGQIESYLVKPTQIIAYFIPLVIGIAYFAMPVLVKYILPRYIPGLNACKILMGGIFFVCVAYPSYIFMITVNRQFLLARVLFATLVTAVLLNYFSIKKGLGLEGVALAMGLSYFIYFMSLTLYTVKKVLNVKNNGRIFLTVFGSFLYFVVLVLIIDNFVVLGNPVVNMLLKTGIFLVSGAVFITCCNRDTYVINKLFGKTRYRKSIFPEEGETVPEREPDSEVLVK